MGPRQMGQGFESPEELEVLLLDSSFMALLSLKAKPIRSYHIYSLCPIIFDPQKIKIKKNLPVPSQIPIPIPIIYLFIIFLS
jgi:hypothetical protein